MTLPVVAEVLRRLQIQGWLVGGSVRDSELGSSSPDLDIVVAGDAAAVARAIARELRAPWFVLSERHPAYRIMAGEGRIDVAPVKGDGILDDLAERDFTVNAMAVPIGGAEVLDPFGGLGHLRERRLVPVSERIFRDDPLRMMRAARFHHLLGLGLTPDLAAAIKQQASLLATTAAERIVAEVALTLGAGRTAEAVRLWFDLGLLEQFLPEAHRGDRGVEPVLSLLSALDDLLAEPGVWFPETAPALAARLQKPVDGVVARPVALRLAGVLHEVTPAKAVRLARRLRLSTDMGSLLSAVARRGAGSGPPAHSRGREAVLFLWGAAPWEPEVILVEAARAAAQAGVEHLPVVCPVVDTLRGLLQLWCEREWHGVPPAPIDGVALMAELGLESGPVLGSVLREARLAWEAGEAAGRDEVMTVARAALARATEF